MVDVILLVSKKPYPDVLTKKYYDKKKSVLGKLQVKKTGIGANLDSLEGIFKKIDFDAIDMQKIASGRSATMDLSRFDADVDEVIKTMKSEFSYIHSAAKSVEDMIDEALPRFKKKELNSDVKLCKELKDALDELRETYDPNAWAKAMMVHAAGTKKGFADLLKLGKKVLAKEVATALKELNELDKLDQPTAALLNGNYRTRRSVGMNLRNAFEGAKAGLTPAYDAKTAEKLYHRFQPYTKAGFPQELSPEMVKKVIKGGIDLLEEIKKLTV